MHGLQKIAKYYYEYINKWPRDHQGCSRARKINFKMAACPQFQQIYMNTVDRNDDIYFNC